MGGEARRHRLEFRRIKLVSVSWIRLLYLRLVHILLLCAPAISLQSYLAHLDIELLGENSQMVRNPPGRNYRVMGESKLDEVSEVLLDVSIDADDTGALGYLQWGCVENLSFADEKAPPVAVLDDMGQRNRFFLIASSPDPKHRERSRHGAVRLLRSDIGMAKEAVLGV